MVVSNNLLHTYMHVYVGGYYKIYDQTYTTRNYKKTGYNMHIIYYYI